jgi:hypothetical protein
VTRERTWSFVLACALAGALSIPPDPIATPLATIFAGLLGLLGLRIWQWSHLPSLVASGAQPRGWRLPPPFFFLTLGLLVGLTLLAVIRLVIEPRVPEIGLRIEAAAALPIWRRTAIIYVAAVAEELIFRVVLFSLIVGIVIRLRRRTTRVPTPAIVWSANAVSALAFAAVHLPAWSGTASSVALPLAVLALNTAAGLVIGRVFATRGIAAAIWTHAGGDCAIQLIGPLTG